MPPPATRRPQLDLARTATVSRMDGARKTEVKIAYIGGGSRFWAVRLLGDLALSDRLAGELALYDIDLGAAAHNVKLAEEIPDHSDARGRFRVRVEKRLEDALCDADFVVISIEPGPTSPAGAACFVRRALDEQSLTLAAALERDADRAFQVLLTHPLVHLPTDRAWAMFKEMIEATREMLPGWK